MKQKQWISCWHIDASDSHGGHAMERWVNERSMCHSKPSASSLTFGRLDHAVASGPAKSASGNSDARRKSLYTHRPACSTLSTTSRREYPPFSFFVVRYVSSRRFKSFLRLRKAWIGLDASSEVWMKAPYSIGLLVFLSVFLSS